MIEAPINMRDFKNTIHKWFVDSTGLLTIWRNQSEYRPEFPYGSLQILNGPILAASQFDVRNEMLDEQVKHTYYIPCSFIISCQAYVRKPDSNNPDKNAQYYLNKAQASLSLQSVQNILSQKNISYITVSDVQNISELIADSYESRANIDVTFGTALSLIEYETFIQKIQIVSTGFDVDQIIDGGF